MYISMIGTYDGVNDTLGKNQTYIATICTPNFWQRIKFLFCKRMIVSGAYLSPNGIMNVTFEYK